MKASCAGTNKKITVNVEVLSEGSLACPQRACNMWSTMSDGT
jgi:hypothetical protein